MPITNTYQIIWLHKYPVFSFFFLENKEWQRLQKKWVFLSVGQFVAPHCMYLYTQVHTLRTRFGVSSFKPTKHAHSRWQLVSQTGGSHWELNGKKKPMGHVVSSWTDGSFYGCWPTIIQVNSNWIEFIPNLIHGRPTLSPVDPVIEIVCLEAAFGTLWWEDYQYVCCHFQLYQGFVCTQTQTDVVQIMLNKTCGDGRGVRFRVVWQVLIAPQEKISER